MIGDLGHPLGRKQDQIHAQRLKPGIDQHRIARREQPMTRTLRRQNRHHMTEAATCEDPPRTPMISASEDNPSGKLHPPARQRVQLLNLDFIRIFANLDRTHLRHPRQDMEVTRPMPFVQVLRRGNIDA